MQRIVLERKQVDASLLEPALDALAAGELVVVPTETLYLLAGDAKRTSRLLAAEARIRQTCGVTPARVWLGTPEMTAPALAGWPLPAQRLAQRYWPGPLQVRLPKVSALPEMMVPGEPVTRALLECHGGALLALALPVAPPVTDAVRAKRALRELAGEEVRPRVLLDSGPSAYGCAPARVEVAAFAVRVTSFGPLDVRRLREAARVHVAFVCTGNICRSPLAAAMLRALAQRDAEATFSGEYEPVLKTSSCGIAALSGSPAPPEAHTAAEPHGAEVYLREHRAKQANAQELATADIILVAAREHRSALLRLAPELEPRIHPLEPNGKDVRDPYMESPRVYEQVAQTIRRGLAQRFFGG